MAVQGPLVEHGWFTLSTSYDARRSSITGTTLNGPNGSGQFFPCFLSTLNAGQVTLSTGGTTPSTFALFIGILQNAPGPAEACDIAIFGVSKAIAASTFVTGTLLQPSSTTAGQVTPYLQGNGPPIGFAIDTVTSTSQVFALGLFGWGHGGYTT